LTSWLAERGRKLGGGQLEEREEGSGVGSGIFSRYGIGPAMPSPGVGVGSSGGGRPASAADRDTRKLNETGSSPATDEEIGLAPLEDETLAGQAKAAEMEDELVTSSDIGLSAAIKAPGSGSKKSLVEEELHDPVFEAIKRKVAQRAQYNPLQPVGYVPPNKSQPWGLWLLLGGVVLVVVTIAVMLLI
jgi:hypothetical protein